MLNIINISDTFEFERDRVGENTCMISPAWESSKENHTPVEIDFLEWLCHNHDLFDFRKMPVKTFEHIVDQFVNDCNKSSHDKYELIDAFKYTKQNDLIKKLLSFRNSSKALGLTSVIYRYQNEKIPFKCFILQKSRSSKEYQELVEEYWEDLHHLSSDDLDIYYDTSYGVSGFEIARQMTYIPEHLKTRVPVIVLWADDLTKAQGIDIRQLSNDEIFEVIRCIVEAIRDKKSFDNIVMEANHMADELREGQRPIGKIGVQITGGQVSGGVFTGINEETQTVVYNADSEANNNTKELLEGFTTAEEIIRSFEELDDNQKGLVVEVLNEARDAVKANSDEKIKASKKQFSNTIKLLGTVGKDLIGALAGVASILKFFGFGPV